MNIDYNDVKGLSEEEFEKYRPPEAALTNKDKFTVASDADVTRIEKILDVAPSALEVAKPFYFERVSCACGSELSMFDFVSTALIDAGHSKSLILHTLVGSKLIANKPRRVRCMSCGELTPRHHIYYMQGYICNVPWERP